MTLAIIFIIFSIKSCISSDSSIFWNNLTSNDIIDVINTIESIIKIFIYPIPIETNQYINLSKELDDVRVLRHFRSEYIFRDFLKQQSNNKQNSLVVTDPSKANIFLIDHDIARLYSTGQCSVIYSIYLPLIINNVVDNYPYYNQSQGRNHFFFATYDEGPFCDPFCYPDVDTSIYKRIVNASFIGNYGMDKKHFIDNKYNNTVTTECHRANYDIVIPQMIREDSLKFHEIFADNNFPYRFYDSTFAGTLWNERKLLGSMCLNNSYEVNCCGVERLFCHLHHSPRLDLIFKGYFTYCACGHACWSQV